MKQTNVLLADDNADLLNTLSQILGLHGCKVQTAEDGLDAVGKASEANFDVILMDIIMPRMNGIEAFRTIKKSNPSAKVILMTAYYEEDEMEKALSEGVLQALHKPVDIRELIEIIDEATSEFSIIVADDDRSIAETLTRMLELAGYKAYAAASGEEAIKIALHKQVHMAFIDVMMPSMNGPETANRLKALKPGIANIMMTAYRGEVQEMVNGALATSAEKCLYKPFEPSEIMELVGLHAKPE